MSDPIVTQTPVTDLVGSVLTDVHKLLDDAKTEIGNAASVLGGDVRQVVHDGIEEIKARLAKLTGHSPSTAPAAPVVPPVGAETPAAASSTPSSPSTPPADPAPEPVVPAPANGAAK